MTVTDWQLVSIVANIVGTWITDGGLNAIVRVDPVTQSCLRHICDRKIRQEFSQ